MGYFWKRLESIDDCKSAARAGSYVCFLMGLIYAVFIAQKHFGLGAIFDVAVFWGTGLALFFLFSRTAAVLAFCYFFMTLLYIGVETQKTMTGSAVLLGPFMFNAVRASWWYHQFKKAEKTENSNAMNPNFLVVFWLNFGPAFLALVLAVASVIGIILHDREQKRKSDDPSQYQGWISPLLKNIPAAKTPSHNAVSAAIPAEGQRTFRLKSGKSVRGLVTYEDETYLTVQTSSGTETLFREDLA